MRREIADSDDESDLVLPPVKGLRAATTAGPAALDVDITVEQLEQSDPVLNIDFAGLCSPTQRISSYDGNLDNNDYELNTSNVLDSSTNRFLNEVAPNGSSHPAIDIGDTDIDNTADMGGDERTSRSAKEKTSKKRSHAQTDDGSGRTTSTQPKKKRTKTYSSATVSDKISNAVEFQASLNENNASGPTTDNNADQSTMAASIKPSDLVSIEPRNQYTSPLDLSLHLSPTHDVSVEAQKESIKSQNSQAQHTNFHQSNVLQGTFFGANLRGGTASKSSIGNYQSYSIDPAALGMDFSSINPFGSLSQVSLGGEEDSADSRAIAEIFRTSASNRRDTLQPKTDSVDILNNAVDDMATSPFKSDQRIDVPEEFDVQAELPQVSPTFSPITNPDDRNPSVENEGAIESLDQPLGQKSAQDQFNTEMGQTTKAQPKRHGRKPKREIGHIANVDDKDDLDELHLEEPVIPRGVRAGTVDSVTNASDVSQATTSSKKGRKRKGRNSEIKPPEVLSKKLPSSDLGLDNKAVIGLSPERYVPRPSRRRGRGESNPEPQVSLTAVTEMEDEQSTTETNAQINLSKKGRGKKAKAKQAKTRKSIDLPDSNEKEDEKEVILIDDEPVSTDARAAAEKDQKDGDSKHDVEEDACNNLNEEEEEDDINSDDDAIRKKGRRTQITVDVPVLTKTTDHEELPPSIPEPKKRGRKRKKAVEELAQQDVADDEQKHHRSVLAEIDANVQSNGSNTNSSKSASCDVESEDIKPTTASLDTDATDSNTSQKPKLDTESPVPKPAKSPSKTSTPFFNVRGRIGLSKRHSIPSLLRKVDRNKEPPKAIEKKEKLTKRQLEEREQERIAREEAEAEGREYVPIDLLRGKDGLLVEWDF